MTQQTLDETIDELWEHARDFGLEPYDITFEIVPSTQLYNLVAYGAPGRYRHWTFGKRYHKQKKRYDMGLGRVLELVINANPSRAYLLSNNHLAYHKMVAAHVIGHVDFFKNNIFFSKTNENKPNILQAHRDRMLQYEEEHGVGAVEDIITKAQAFERHRPFTPILAQEEQGDRESDDNAERGSALKEEYGELFDDDYFEADRDQDEQDNAPEEARDLLSFLAAHSEALDDWERDVLMMIHDEETYFLPQYVTGAMNEGWACLAHTRLMEKLDLTEQEKTRYAKKHGRVIAPRRTSYNEYLVGLRIWEDLLERKGMEFCKDVRKHHHDPSFFRNFLTDKLVDELQLHEVNWKHDKDNEWTEAQIGSREAEKIRQTMANQAAHRNIPPIVVDRIEDNTVHLQHEREGPELKRDDARVVLGYFEDLWHGSVVLHSNDDTLKPEEDDE